MKVAAIFTLMNKTKKRTDSLSASLIFWHYSPSWLSPATTQKNKNFNFFFYFSFSFIHMHSLNWVWKYVVPDLTSVFFFHHTIQKLPYEFRCFFCIKKDHSDTEFWINFKIYGWTFLQFNKVTYAILVCFNISFVYVQS